MSILKEEQKVIHMEQPQVNLPTDLLSMERYKAMPPVDKDRYIYSVLKKILDLNPNGVTISMVQKAIGFTHATVWHHLEKMNTTREAYKLDYGNTTIYFANGKMVHHLKNIDITVRDKNYSFYLVENNFGTFVYLQEKKQNRLGVTEICGGLLLHHTLLEEFIQSLQKVKSELKKRITEGEDNVYPKSRASI